MYKDDGCPERCENGLRKMGMELAVNSKWRTSFSESGGNFGQS